MCYSYVKVTGEVFDQCQLTILVLVIDLPTETRAVTSANTLSRMRESIRATRRSRALIASLPQSLNSYQINGK